MAMFCPVCKNETLMLFPSADGHACRDCKDKPSLVETVPKAVKTYGLVFDATQGKLVLRGRDKSYPPQFSLWQRSPPWHPHWVFEGYEDCHLICVGPSANDEWYWEDHHELDTWIFFRTREQWKRAWQLARIIARHGYGRAGWTSEGHDLVLAYKLPFRETLIVNAQSGRQVLDFDWRVKEGDHRLDVSVYTHPNWDNELHLPSDGSAGAPQEYLVSDEDPNAVTLKERFEMSRADYRCMAEFEG